MTFLKIILYKISPQGGGGPLAYFMLHTLLFALWFQDKHATQVKYTAGNHYINIVTCMVFICFIFCLLCFC